MSEGGAGAIGCGSLLFILAAVVDAVTVTEFGWRFVVHLVVIVTVAAVLLVVLLRYSAAE